MDIVFVHPSVYNLCLYFCLLLSIQTRSIPSEGAFSSEINIPEFGTMALTLWPQNNPRQKHGMSQTHLIFFVLKLSRLFWLCHLTVKGISANFIVIWHSFFHLFPNNSNNTNNKILETKQKENLEVSITFIQTWIRHHFLLRHWPVWNSDPGPQHRWSVHYKVCLVNW